MFASGSYHLPIRPQPIEIYARGEIHLVVLKVVAGMELSLRRESLWPSQAVQTRRNQRGRRPPLGKG